MGVLVIVLSIGIVVLASWTVVELRRRREVDRRKDEFVAVVSHELRTPLTAIRASLDLLMADPKAVPAADSRKLLGIAITSCERLVRLVNDLLDLSKIEAGKMDLQLRPLPVKPLLTSAIDDVKMVADMAGVRFALRVPPETPPVRGDADRLTHALINLLANAVNYAPRGSAVTVSAHETAGAVAINVEDHGHGIPPAELPRVFHKFHRGEHARLGRITGTGLGLAIVQAIVERHGGSVGVHSVVGVGTTFTMTLPRTETLTDAPAF